MFILPSSWQQCGIRYELHLEKEWILHRATLHGTFARHAPFRKSGTSTERMWSFHPTFCVVKQHDRVLKKMMRQLNFKSQTRHRTALHDQTSSVAVVRVVRRFDVVVPARGRCLAARGHRAGVRGNDAAAARGTGARQVRRRRRGTAVSGTGHVHDGLERDGGTGDGCRQGRAGEAWYYECAGQNICASRNLASSALVCGRWKEATYKQKSWWPCSSWGP